MPAMKKISVENLKPGMIYNKALYIDANTKIVEANTPIKIDDIKKMMTWGISEIETAGIMLKSANSSPEGDKQTSSIISDGKKIINDYNEMLTKRKDLIKVYSNSQKEVAAIYELIRKDKKFSTEGLRDSLKNIIKLLNSNNNLFLFLYGLDNNDNYLVSHSVNVTFYAIIIGLGLKYSMQQLIKLGLGTLLIDAGMNKIPVYITHKQTDLTDQEFKQIKTHPLYGYKAIRELGELKEDVANISLQHHEQFDGKGYPRGLKGNEINEFARIAAIADSYEAQITKRTYKDKVDFYHAMKNLLSSGVNKFDPILLRIFLSKMSVYPIGSLVEINGGKIGIVIGSVEKKPLRPLVKIIFDENKKKLEKTQILNLLEEPNYYITKALNEKEVGIDIFDVL